MSVFVWGIAGAFATVAGGAAYLKMRRPPVPVEIPPEDTALHRAATRLWLTLMPMSGGPTPFGMHRHDAHLYAMFFSMIRDVYMSEGVELGRSQKEVVAIGVSASNRCHYCAHNHAALLKAADDIETGVQQKILDGDIEGIRDPLTRSLAAYGAASKTPAASRIQGPPLTPVQTADAIITAVSFHYVNRIMDSLGPQGVMLTLTANPPSSIIGRLLKLNAGYRPGPGLAATLALEGLDKKIDVHDADRAQISRWTHGQAPIAEAFLFAWSTIRRQAEALLEPGVTDAIRAHLAGWEGEDPPLVGPWRGAAAARFEEGSTAWKQTREGVVVARAAYRVDRERLLDACGGDRRTRLALASFAACAAALRVAEWLVIPDP